MQKKTAWKVLEQVEGNSDMEYVPVPLPDSQRGLHPCVWLYNKKHLSSIKKEYSKKSKLGKPFQNVSPLGPIQWGVVSFLKRGHYLSSNIVHTRTDYQSVYLSIPSLTMGSIICFRESVKPLITDT